MTRVDADVAIVGSGFAGSLTALCLLRRGKRVVMVERGRHPRFAIGESSTPLANLLIEELADRYDLPRIRPFSKWGTWQRTRPEVPCGLKRGFSFFFHRLHNRFEDDDARARQLLVAASPHDEIADTHWYRPAFDEALVREAEAAGAIYLDETRLDHVRHEGTLTILEGTRRNGACGACDGAVRHRRERSARVSASRARLRGSAAPVAAAHQRVVHAFRRRGAVGSPAPRRAHDGTRHAQPPYPVDDAALHHVFPGGWIWMLRFNNGITSAGVAHTHGAQADALRLNEGAPAWDRLLETLPSVREQFRAARAVHPFIYAPRVAFRSRQVCGDTWALLPSAAGVIDPLLSTGFPLTLLGIARLVDLLERTAAGSAERQTALREYAQVTQDELDITEQLVGALYANMTDPPVFKRLGLLYFAAASFSEAARRLGRPELAPGFLLHQHPRFGPELRACAAEAVEIAAMASSDDATVAASSAPCAAASGALREALLARIDAAIEPFDIAGLRDRTRRDWYPALAEDLDRRRGETRSVCRGHRSACWHVLDSAVGKAG